MTEPVPVDDLPYADALAELESILDRLEHTEPDVDRIAADVARAADLVKHCRGRIETARLSVEDVVAGLAGPTATAGPDGSVDDAT
jgi:exodeoxyribonuclease VII small subunit